MEEVFRKLTTRGRISVPKAVLDELGAKPGDTLEYRIEKDEVTLRRAESIDRKPR